MCRQHSLHAHIQEEVYARPPAGDSHLGGGNGRVLRLKFALYGLRQASRAWSRRVGDTLRALGFVPSEADPSLWVLRNKVGVVLALFYVNDGIVAAKSDAEPMLL
jgi:hypothetical protein